MKLAPAWTYLGLTVVLVVLVGVPPLVGDRYITTVFLSVLIFFILGAIFDFMLGYLRIVNFGVGGFLAAGAYGSALLNYHYGVSPWIGLVAGGMVSLALGVFAGVVTLRLHGIYIGLTTFFVAELVRFSISSSREVTRGSLGLSTKNFPDLFGYEFARSDPLGYYYLVLVLAALIYLLLTCIVRSRMGLLFKAVRDDQLATSVLGFNVERVKLINFAVASFCFGVIGAFYGNYVGILVPSTQEFGIPRTIEVLTIAYVGGRGTLWGSLLGAFALIGIQEIFRTADEWRLVIYGAFLVLVLMVFPRGLAGAVQASAWWLQNRFVRLRGDSPSRGQAAPPSDRDVEKNEYNKPSDKAPNSARPPKPK
jgi:branched-chain amino acid transport system permease protein